MTRLDLHVHTALSACAENVMSPGRIVGKACEHGLQMLAVTDHNASAHVELAMELGRERGITVVPGMELTTSEEVHVLVYFPSLAALTDFQRLVDASLPADENVPDVFGYQVLYDRDDEIVGLDERLRQVGCRLGIETAVHEVRQRGGFAVPAHVRRYRNSLTSQLGFIDPEAGFDAVQVMVATWRREGLRVGDRIAGYPVMTGSDAHFLEDVGRTYMEIPGNVRDFGAVLGVLAGVKATV